MPPQYLRNEPPLYSLDQVIHLGVSTGGVQQRPAIWHASSLNEAPQPPEDRPAVPPDTKPIVFVDWFDHEFLQVFNITPSLEEGPSEMETVRTVTHKLLALKAELKSYYELTLEPADLDSAELDGTVGRGWERLLAILGIDNGLGRLGRRGALQRALDMARELSTKIEKAHQEHLRITNEILSSSPDDDLVNLGCEPTAPGPLTEHY